MVMKNINDKKKTDLKSNFFVEKLKTIKIKIKSINKLILTCKIENENIAIKQKR